MYVYTKYIGTDWHDHAVAALYVSYSADEGDTWTVPALLLEKDKKAENIMSTSLIRLQNGRILVPMSYHGFRAGAVIVASEKKQADIRFAYSDDNGNTWAMLDAAIATPFDDNLGFAEPGIYEHEDGELWYWFRSGIQSHSPELRQRSEGTLGIRKTHTADLRGQSGRRGGF